ncbi:MAG TPA: hypothetical protein VKX17_19700 [Planctomycetota bacterium]|nr:hypothetical protein [Planctomycetota bacterium]
MTNQTTFLWNGITGISDGAYFTIPDGVGAGSYSISVSGQSGGATSQAQAAIKIIKPDVGPVLIGADDGKTPPPPTPPDDKSPIGAGIYRSNAKKHPFIEIEGVDDNGTKKIGNLWLNNVKQVLFSKPFTQLTEQQKLLPTKEQLEMGEKTGSYLQSQPPDVEGTKDYNPWSKTPTDSHCAYLQDLVKRVDQLGAKKPNGQPSGADGYYIVKQLYTWSTDDGKTNNVIPNSSFEIKRTCTVTKWDNNDAPIEFEASVEISPVKTETVLTFTSNKGQLAGAPTKFTSTFQKLPSGKWKLQKVNDSTDHTLDLEVYNP